MAIRFPVVMNAKQVLRRPTLASKKSFTCLDVPKGHLAVYVGECQKKRYVVPISLLRQPLFQELLSKVEEEFGYDHPMGGLTIPCREDIFLNLLQA